MSAEWGFDPKFVGPAASCTQDGSATAAGVPMTHPTPTASPIEPELVVA